jgi:hypothetical protein
MVVLIQSHYNSPLLISLDEVQGSKSSLPDWSLKFSPSHHWSLSMRTGIMIFTWLRPSRVIRTYPLWICLATKAEDFIGFVLSNFEDSNTLLFRFLRFGLQTMSRARSLGHDLQRRHGLVASLTRPFGGNLHHNNIINIPSSQPAFHTVGQSIIDFNELSYLRLFDEKKSLSIWISRKWELGRVIIRLNQHRIDEVRVVPAYSRFLRWHFLICIS